MSDAEVEAVEVVPARAEVYYGRGPSEGRYTLEGLALDQDLFSALAEVRKRHPRVRVREFGAMVHSAAEMMVSEELISAEYASYTEER